MRAFVLPTVGGNFACSHVDVAFGSMDVCSPLMIMVTSGTVGDGGRHQALWESAGSELYLLLVVDLPSGGGTTDFSPPLLFFLFYLTLI